MREEEQIKFSIQSVNFAIEDMLKKGKTHLFYPQIFEGDQIYEPGILRKHILDVVIALQQTHQGRLVISRTPGGIVVDALSLR